MYACVECCTVLTSPGGWSIRPVVCLIAMIEMVVASCHTKRCVLCWGFSFRLFPAVFPCFHTRCRVAYHQFSAGLYGLIPNVTSDPETRSAVERVRMKIAERGGLNGIRTLAKIMATMDNSGDKRLDREELKWGMRDYGVTLSDRELDIVLAAFDRNKDGKIDFDEFLRGIRVCVIPLFPPTSLSCVSTMVMFGVHRAT